ncbi:uncharacterized protein LOC134456480 [Engraulis encrasicolus]|uniref:uncharacterized protein LOC134456480 n=1 Tax=Engraulis encrasicolus TaxID=184585 RepID=UPI002FD2C9B0
MRAAISLLVLLLSMCGVQTEGQGTDTSSQDVSTELKELRDLVVDLRATVRHTRDDVKVLETDNVAVKGRLVASETKVQALQENKAEMKTEVDNLKRENAAQEVELAVLKTRLAATETEVKDLKMKASAALEQELTAVKTRLAASETTVDDLKKENAAQEAELTAVKTRLANSETKVENLENEIRAAPKVAFSAGLGYGSIESGRRSLDVVFSRVITNVGQAYNSTTGFFTAPVRGVYYFSFTVMDNLDSRYMIIRMYKNRERLMWLNEHDTDGKASYLSGGLTLQLEKGDTVILQIPEKSRLYDNDSNHSTFSGFLLFPL